VRVRAATAALVLSLALGGCVSPAFGPDSYRGKAEQAVGAAISEVGTAQLVVEQVLGGRLPKAYADEVVSASEDALDSISASLGSVQPPTESDEIRDEALELIGDAEEAVADARIAVRRGDTTALEGLAEQLRQLGEDLTALEERLR
jgi:hypothetical protein